MKIPVKIGISVFSDHMMVNLHISQEHASLHNSDTKLYVCIPKGDYQGMHLASIFRNYQTAIQYYLSNSNCQQSDQWGMAQVPWPFAYPDLFLYILILLHLCALFI